MNISNISLNNTLYDLDSQYKTPSTVNNNISDKYTWEELKNKVTKGDFSDLHIGDYKILTVNGQDLKMRIAGIDTYYATEHTHHIDWISNTTIGTNIISNYGNNGSGTYSSSTYSGGNPFMYSSAFSSFLKNFITNLPVELTQVIKNKMIYAEYRVMSSGSPVQNSTSNNLYNFGQLWVPTEYEYFGDAILGTKKYSNTGQERYPLFANFSFFDNNSTDYLSATAVKDNIYNWVTVSRWDTPNSTNGSNKVNIPLCFRL